MKNHYVYYLIDPRTNQPFYVGKGQRYRMFEHEQKVRAGIDDNNPEKQQVIRDIIAAGLSVICTAFDSFDAAEEALKREKMEIISLGKRKDGGLLTNIRVGDEKPTRVERRVLMCEYTTGNVLQVFDSVKSATAFLGRKYTGDINNAIKGRSPACGGFLWCYEGETPTLPRSLIYQWNDSGELIATHKNEGDAARSVGSAQAALHDALVNHRRCKGFLFSKVATFPGLPPDRKFRVWTTGVRNKQVEHVQTGRIFASVSEAAKEYGHGVGAVSAVCNGKKPNIAGNVFRYLALPADSTTDE